MKICLNMVVRDEESCIIRCLDSVKPLINSFCIIDTGSKDNTMELIYRWGLLNNIEGTLLSRKWVNFSHNRNEAIEAALEHEKPDYLFFLDADEILTIANLPEELTDPAYSIKMSCGSDSYPRVALLRADNPARYKGVLHECLPISPAAIPTLDGIFVIATADGARSKDPLKYVRDGQLLRSQGTTPRDKFYEAQSWACAGLLHEAQAAYQQRIDMDDGLFPEELFMAKFRLANIKRDLNLPISEVTHAYLSAWVARPHRAEPLHNLCAYLRLQSQYHLAYLLAKQGISIKLPEDDVLFVEKSVYEWKMRDEYSLAAYYSGRPVEARETWLDILHSGVLPLSDHQRVEKNLEFTI